MYPAAVERLNYHHLLYFWLAAREGSVSRAAARLRLAQPTLSGQIRTLEGALGERLFERAGRRLRLTEAGTLVFGFADEIFSVGEELMDAVKQRPSRRPARVTIGLADVVAKPVAHRLIQPLLDEPEPVRLIVREDSPEKLLAALVGGDLDVVLLDAPPGPEAGVRVFSRLLGESGVSLLAAPRIAARYRRRFPRSLEGAPFLLPGRTTGLRRSLEAWFDRHGVRPSVVGEIDDSALTTVFARAGSGIVAVPSVVERDVCRQHRLARVGRVEGVREQVFAVSLQRRFGNPAVERLRERARRDLYARSGARGTR